MRHIKLKQNISLIISEAIGLVAIATIAIVRGLVASVAIAIAIARGLVASVAIAAIAIARGLVASSVAIGLVA